MKGNGKLTGEKNGSIFRERQRGEIEVEGGTADRKVLEVLHSMKSWKL